jgi:transposase-like protein
LYKQIDKLKQGEDRSCDNCGGIFNSIYFPYKSVNLCVWCYEKEHNVVLHSFREKIRLTDRKSREVFNRVINKKDVATERCPDCNSLNNEKKGFRSGKQRYICRDCGRNWTSSNISASRSIPIKVKNSSDDIEEQILKIISEQPGLKARRIAIILGIDRKKVNSIIYHKLSDKCIKDGKYRWYLKKNFSSENSIEENDTTDINKDKACPICGSNMVLRSGKYGKFYGCSKYPRCTGTRSFNK